MVFFVDKIKLTKKGSRRESAVKALTQAFTLGKHQCPVPTTGNVAIGYLWQPTNKLANLLFEPCGTKYFLKVTQNTSISIVCQKLTAKVTACFMIEHLGDTWFYYTDSQPMDIQGFVT